VIKIEVTRDIVNFIKHVLNPVTNEPNSEDSTQWILVGGSYAENLVAWVKQDFYKYNKTI
jgi:hypothetical protein